ncbi:hypothetical protein [Streptomyces sp. NPDC004135]
MSDLTRKVFLAEVAAVNEHLVQQQPASDRAALRDRIAAAIWERQNPGRHWADCEHPWGADAEEDADAVLAVLPPPVSRAAVLREAAERIESGGLFVERWYPHQVATLLRRLADEAQPADVEHCIHDRAVHTRHHHQPVTGCPWCAAREQP